MDPGEDDESEDEALARVLSEFGIYLPPVEDAGSDNGELPGWDEDEIGSWG